MAPPFTSSGTRFNRTALSIDESTSGDGFHECRRLKPSCRHLGVRRAVYELSESLTRGNAEQGRAQGAGGSHPLSWGVFFPFGAFLDARRR